MTEFSGVYGQWHSMPFLAWKGREGGTMAVRRSSSEKARVHTEAADRTWGV